ncbi:hypothetical protein GQ55_4G164200 [Panicum hallii var. hallii]|uniref:Uncharacterized protein n=1 Tax=Panicum hallii var. hallii TaxID=1504633 RepID=A0A2T7DYM0_9POAL|nr:hypothetical protein GQ55_4G164200 [Panicum hallii var. hallii]
MVKEEKQETGVLLNFKYSVSPIRYGDLLHIWNYTKRFFIGKRSTKTFGKTSTFAGLFGKEK